MTTIEDLKQRIRTVGKFKSVVKTMKALATVSIHQFGNNANGRKKYSDRLNELNTQFNRQGQTIITEELLNIVAGFESSSG